MVLIARNGAHYFAGDEEGIELFQNKWVEGDDRRLDLDLLPEPFVGDLGSARVIFLGCNPFSGDRSNRTDHSDPRFVRAARGNWNREPREDPFFLISDAFRWCEGFSWWRSLLDGLRSELQRRSGVDEPMIWRHLARWIAVAELYPYHSRKGWPHRLVRHLPSSRRTHARVREAWDRGAILVHIWKGADRERHWRKALLLPEQAPGFVQARRSTDLSPAGIGAEAYTAVLTALMEGLPLRSR